MVSKIYQTQTKEQGGKNYKNLYTYAYSIYKDEARKTKRRAYIRSKYFKKEKIFLDYFWDHIRTKNYADRSRRLKYYECAIDLIKHSNIKSDLHFNQEKVSEILHRFVGKTPSNSVFCVQIKENLKNGQKHFISVFPVGDFP